MARKPWMKFYPADWQSDEALRMCSFAARGLWVELLALAHKSETVGHVMPGGRVPSAKQLAILCGGTEKEIPALLAELRDAGVYDVGPGGVIISRRLIRDAEKAERDRENGRTGGNPLVIPGKRKGVNPPVNPDELDTVNQQVTGGDKAQWPLASGLSVECISSVEVGIGEGSGLTPGDALPFDAETGEVWP